MSNGKDMTIRLTVWLIKMILNEILLNTIPLYKNESILSKPLRGFRQNFNVKVDLSNYATKTDLKNVTHVDTSSFALKTDLVTLKTEVDILHIDKLAPFPVDLSKMSDAVKNDVVKKAVYDKLVAKVNNIDTSDFVLKTKYQTDKVELENKVPDVTDLVKKKKTHWIRKQNPRC